MKYCSHCGKQMDDNMSFCPSCGASVNNNVSIQNSMNVASNVNQTMIIRQNTLKELSDYYAYFSKKKDSYDEYESLWKELPPLQAHGAGRAALVFGIIILCFSLFWIPAAIIGKEIGGLIPFAIGAGLIALRIVLESSRKRRIAKINNRISDISDELNEYYRNYGFCSIGAEYSNPDIIAALAKLVQSGRADTTKEAINIMLDDAHKSEMELNAALTSRYAAQTARSSKTTAAFVGLSFFLK